ncbi:MAG: M20/M25/M40 family metallo-hydrolase [Dethiosulfatibacter sp.]|nr:M20/M25/M40 family metallo-hydrolase [Dethiosulfatibacter sp.]
MLIENIHAHINSNREQDINTLIELVSHPSISSNAVEIRRCAEFLKNIMEESGINTKIYETKGQPVVIGEVASHNKDATTVLFYGHYDVQPPEPLDAWVSPQFEPTIREGRLYGRGAGDNKGQLLTHIMAVRSYLATEGALPINVKFIFEGEEEIGSPSLLEFVEDNKELLKADVVLTSDGPIHDSGAPLVAFGVRGVMNFEFNLETATTDNHSGNKGGVIPNAIWKMVDLLATMKDKDDKVTIAGFYDDVVIPSPYELSLIDNLPFDPISLAKVYGVERIELDKVKFYERLLFLPTLTINGIEGGYTGKGTKNIIPCKATAKMEVRLVLNQDPKDIFNKVKNHVTKTNPNVIVTQEEEDMKPSRTSAELPISRAIVNAVWEGFDQEPIVLPSMGGSLPDFVWTKGLGVPSIMIPYANADEANHAPNENMMLECFYKGIHSSAQIIFELGKLKEQK